MLDSNYAILHKNKSFNGVGELCSSMKLIHAHHNIYPTKINAHSIQLNLFRSAEWILRGKNDSQMQ